MTCFWDRFDPSTKRMKPTCEVGAIWKWKGETRSSLQEAGLIFPQQRFKIVGFSHYEGFVHLKATLTGIVYVVKESEFSLQGVASGFWEKE